MSKATGSLRSPLPTLTTSSDFVLYTDETKLFSISYPQEWELGLSLLSEVDVASKELLRSRDVELPLGTFVRVFLVGMPYQDHLDPIVSVVAESLPNEMSIDEYNEAADAVVRDVVENLEVHSQTKSHSGDRQVILVEWETDNNYFTAGQEGKLRNIN